MVGGWATIEHESFVRKLDLRQAFRSGMLGRLVGGSAFWRGGFGVRTAAGSAGMPLPEPVPDRWPHLLPPAAADGCSERQHRVDVDSGPMHPAAFEPRLRDLLVGALYDPAPNRVARSDELTVGDLGSTFLQVGEHLVSGLARYLWVVCRLNRECARTSPPLSTWTVPMARVLTSAHSPPTRGTIAPSTLTCCTAGPATTPPLGSALRAAHPAGPPPPLRSPQREHDRTNPPAYQVEREPATAAAVHRVRLSTCS